MNCTSQRDKSTFLCCKIYPYLFERNIATIGFAYFTRVLHTRCTNRLCIPPLKFVAHTLSDCECVCAENDRRCHRLLEGKEQFQWVEFDCMIAFALIPYSSAYQLLFRNCFISSSINWMVSWQNFYGFLNTISWKTGLSGLNSQSNQYRGCPPYRNSKLSFVTET